MSLLSTIDSPQALKKLSQGQLPALSQELRQYILESVASTGGHLSSNLGTVELTIALHYLFDTPHDRLVWDVGHQAYAHKVLTGRRDDLPFVRQQGHISGFPKRSESIYDTFGTGHSSTSISAALGMAVAARNLGIERQHIAVIGDGAMSAGMVFEALNNAGDTEGINLLVILNDNDMSISPPVGALNKYFSRLISRGLPLYKEASDMSKVMLERLPEPMAEFARRVKGHMKDQAKSLMGGTSLFDEFGFNYIGPIDGHDLDALLPVLDNVKRLGGLQFVHVITKKGQGYELAEADPVAYHGPGKFDPSEGLKKSTGTVAKKTFTQVFSDWLCDMGAADNKLIGITPAMREGSGLVEFEKRFPERYFDVGIAEQHAVTFAGGLATESLKPVVAIYSTFLQRGYDQLIHDVALQDLDVTFALDRAGIVGADGATHAGNYDIAYLRCIPNMVVATPSDEQECRLLLSTCYRHEGPAAVRYPRGAGVGAETSTDLDTVPLGKAVVRREGRKLAVLAFGVLLHYAQPVADKYDLTLVDMRFVKPIDEELLSALAETHDGFVTLEEGSLMGGAGSAVIEYLNQRDINLPVLQLAYPDRFIDHGDQNALRAEVGLDTAGIEEAIQQRFAALLAKGDE